MHLGFVHSIFDKLPRVERESALQRIRQACASLVWTRLCFPATDFCNQSTCDSFVRTHSIFIDIPKLCDPTARLVTTRTSQLLPSRPFVVSMNSDLADEKEFDGLVTLSQ